MGLAHCDIKPENMIVVNTPKGLRVLLIDLDDVVAFGEVRGMGTPERNTVDYYNDIECLTDEHTDELGFLFVKNYIFINDFL